MCWYDDIAALTFITIPNKEQPCLTPLDGATGQPAYQCHAIHAGSKKKTTGAYECYRHAKANWFYLWTDAQVVAFLDTLADTAADLHSATPKGQKALDEARWMRRANQGGGAVVHPRRRGGVRKRRAREARAAENARAAAAAAIASAKNKARRTRRR